MHVECMSMMSMSVNEDGEEEDQQAANLDAMQSVKAFLHSVLLEFSGLDLVGQTEQEATLALARDGMLREAAMRNANAVEHLPGVSEMGGAGGLLGGEKENGSLTTADVKYVPALFSLLDKKRTAEAVRKSEKLKRSKGESETHTAKTDKAAVPGVADV